MANPTIAQHFTELAQKAGVSVSAAKLLGSYLHIDFTRAADEGRIVEMLSAMKPSQVTRLPGDVRGRHLDGSTDHRIVAYFGQRAEPPCDMGEICLGCEPRNADGSCPDARAAA